MWGVFIDREVDKEFFVGGLRLIFNRKWAPDKIKSVIEN